MPNRLTTLLLFGSLLTAAACGSAPPPTGQLTQSKAAVRAAEEVGAENTPKAALHLKMARDHLKNAEALVVEEEFEDATLILKRAESDAELAIALSKEAQARAEAEEAMRKVQELKREME
jgi:hypothetical protein